MTLDEKNLYLRGLDAKDFLDLGADHIAYVREIEFLGKPHFAVHGADGQPLTIAPSHDLALHAISETALEIVTLH